MTSQPTDEDERQQLQKLLEINHRRRRVLEIQKAQAGPSVDPKIELDLQDTLADIERLKRQLEALQPQSPQAPHPPNPVPPAQPPTGAAQQTPPPPTAPPPPQSAQAPPPSDPVVRGIPWFVWIIMFLVVLSGGIFFLLSGPQFRVALGIAGLILMVFGLLLLTGKLHLSEDVSLQMSKR